MSEMMNKCVMAEEEIPSLLQNAQGIIIILEVAGTELLVKKPHLVEHFPLEEKAKSYERRLPLPACRIRYIVFRSERLHILHIFVGRLDLLVVGAAVRDAAHRTDLRGAVKGTSAVLQPVLRDDDIAVQ